MTLPSTDDSRAIVAEIEDDARYGDDSAYDESEIDYPPCRCGQPATGWSEHGATCNACFERDCAIDRAARIHDAAVYSDELPGVPFPF